MDDRLVVLGRPDGLMATVSSYGAQLLSVSVPDGAGERVELIHGPPDQASAHRRAYRYMGSTIGRYANRIAGARFTLDGVEHRLAANDGPNHLHGGPHGFHDRVWDVDAHESTHTVRFRLLSSDGDQGYPGALDVTVTYRIESAAATDTAEAAALHIVFEATTDAPTVVNLTNHAYWNLSGCAASDVSDHRLTLSHRSVVDVDDEGIPTEVGVRPIAGSRLAIDREQPLRDSLGHGGIDHCFVDAATAPGQPCVVLEHPASGRSLQLITDQPGVQIYTGNHFDPRHRAIAFEPQLWPDSPNRPDFPSAVLRPGATYHHHTTYRFPPSRTVAFTSP